MTAYPPQTYSFLDVQCAIAGPGGNFVIGQGPGGISEEGITVVYDTDIGTLSWGADGEPMHSLHAAHGGHCSIRVQKTSPYNAMLNQMYLTQTTSSANYGGNLITVSNPVRGDTIVMQACGFRKMPDNVNAVLGGMMEWIFNCGVIDTVLGNGAPVTGV